MRVPKRRNEKYDHIPADTFMTKEKLQQLKNQLDHLKQVIRPSAAREVKRLAEMGDFSENAAYGMAKGRLRGINQRILDLKQQIKTATVISPTQNDHVEVGNHVTVEINGIRHTYQILGSSETHPTSGIISHVSPLGTALIGKKIGDTVNVGLNDNKKFNVTIINIK